MTSEADVKKALKKVLDALPFFWYFMPVSLGMGVMGIPDFCCIYRGHFIGIETKKPGRRGEKNYGLSELQVRVRKLILAAGGSYRIIDDEETIESFKNWVMEMEGKRCK